MVSSRLRCSTERWVWEKGTLLSVCRVAELPLSILAELALPITFPTSSSVSSSKLYQPSIWSVSWFTFSYNPEGLYYYLKYLLFHTPRARWSHRDSAQEDNEDSGRNPECRPVASPTCDSHWINHWSLQTKNHMSLLGNILYQQHNCKCNINHSTSTCTGWAWMLIANYANIQY